MEPAIPVSLPVCVVPMVRAPKFEPVICTRIVAYTIGKGFVRKVICWR